MAVAAATEDSRFASLTASELETVEIEISVLSPFRKISSPQEIELGRHGVMVKKGRQTGIFLPQVATETGWDKEEFLNELCSQKAGLPPTAWRDDKEVELYTFTAQVFSE
jgi:AmmeMemoRadiSam system protein A